MLLFMGALCCGEGRYFCGNDKKMFDFPGEKLFTENIPSGRMSPSFAGLIHRPVARLSFRGRRAFLFWSNL